MSDENMMSASKAAELKGVSRQAVVAAITAGKLQGKSDNGGWKVSPEDLSSWTPKNVTKPQKRDEENPNEDHQLVLQQRDVLANALAEYTRLQNLRDNLSTTE